MVVFKSKKPVIEQSVSGFRLPTHLSSVVYILMYLFKGF
uniref:Uncharacterized protein n=1 Tax=Myoviridae sp. ctLnO19 TaxID=2825085 RepID=A0A8S5P1M7_9CAUD|nr:MAG TPA: hypothetical protein [Myoviridae sp. ctLnO19]DAJ69120.1 MAG TPA: hypothetical protein [Caudoviricetes sp.]